MSPKYRFVAGLLTAIAFFVLAVFSLLFQYVAAIAWTRTSAARLPAPA